jgi:signal transduction histidine kinase/ActR/RegA family two-component response regulator
VAAAGKWSGELPHVTRDGQEVIVASRWTLLGDADGKPRSKLVINTDITEKKKTEAKLMRAQRMENIGQLASGIAHDLNNILAPLTISVDLLGLSQMEPSNPVLLATMQANLKRGIDLVKQILTFARGLESQRQMVQLGTIIDELVKLFQETFPRSITVEMSVPKTLWLVDADPTQMHQVLTNLCVNARDAMPHGGQLRITARNQRLEEQEAGQIPELTPGAYVVLEVEDTGMGIPADIRAKIFDPFFTTKEVGKGTGLGLSTSQDIIKNHGGTIRLESEVGTGTRFTLYLPAREMTEAAPAEPEHRELPGGKGELILVVDDEAALLHIAQVTLTVSGYQVLTAQDGAAAVALYAERSQDIQAVLVDLMMPVMDGSATAEALQGLNPDVRIIVLSGLLAGPETAHALGPGVKDFLPKPYTMEALLTTLRRVLELKSP